MGIFGRKRNGDDTDALNGAAPERAVLPEGAHAESVDLSAADDAAPISEEPGAQAFADPAGGTGLFYRQPEALSAERHGDLRVTRGEHGFGFARGAHLVPLTWKEFPLAAQHYPIVFTGPQRLAAAVMGLRPGANLFIGADGAFERGAYAPAYLRQYPFLAARQRDQERTVLLIDRASDFVTETGGSALFEAGEPTDFTKGALSFLMKLHAEWEETLAFTERMKALDLFEVKELKLAPRSASSASAEPLVKYVALDTRKLADLSGDVLKDLAGSHALMAIYAQQQSLYNWSKVIARAYGVSQQAA